MLLGIIVKLQTKPKKPGVPPATAASAMPAAAPVNRDPRQRKVLHAIEKWYKVV